MKTKQKKTIKKLVLIFMLTLTMNMLIKIKPAIAQTTNQDVETSTSIVEYYNTQYINNIIELLSKYKTSTKELQESTKETSKQNQEKAVVNDIESLSAKIAPLSEKDSKNTNSNYATKRLIVISSEKEFNTYGATSVISYDNIHVLQYNDETACKIAYKNLRNNSLINSVEPDTIMQTEETSENHKEEENHNAPTQLKMHLDSLIPQKQIKVAILDTGIDTTKFKNIINLGINLSSTGEKDSIFDDNGHGTEMATIILKNSNQNVKLMPIKVANKEGKATILNTYLGIKKAIENGADIINISMNTYKSTTSQILTNIIDEATKKGIKVVISAGNDSQDTTNITPSNIESAIVVSAINEKNNLASYSNYGNTVDYCAYGTYEGKTGTSYATANVTGIIADILTKGEDIETLNQYAVDLGEKGKDQNYGNGFIGYEYINNDSNNNNDNNDSTIGVGNLYVPLGDTSFDIKSNFDKLKYNPEYYDINFVSCTPEFDVNKEGEYSVQYKFTNKKNQSESTEVSRIITVMDDKDFFEKYYNLNTSFYQKEHNYNGNSYIAYVSYAGGHYSRQFGENYQFKDITNLKLYLALQQLEYLAKDVQDDTNVTWQKIFEEVKGWKDNKIEIHEIVRNDNVYRKVLAYELQNEIKKMDENTIKTTINGYKNDVKKADEKGKKYVPEDSFPQKVQNVLDNIFKSTDYIESNIKFRRLRYFGLYYGDKLASTNIREIKYNQDDDYNNKMDTLINTLGENKSTQAEIIEALGRTEKGISVNFVPILKEEIWLEENDSITFNFSGTSCNHVGVFGAVYVSKKDDPKLQNKKVTHFVIKSNGGADKRESTYTAQTSGYYSFSAFGMASACYSASPYIQLNSDYTIIETTYDITYLDVENSDFNGNKNPNPETYTKNSENITLINPNNREGFTFEGWTGGAYGKEYSDEKKKEITIKKGSTGDREYIAHWTPNTYTVTYKPNGGSGSDVTDTRKYNTYYTIKSNNELKFTRAGYTFTGWNTKANGTGKTYKVGENITTLTDNLTLYAQWIPNITYNANGGTNSKGDKQPTYTALMNDNGYKVRNNSSTSEKFYFTKTGYTFAGWNTKANGTGTTYTVGASLEKQTTPLTLYAQWRPNTYTVTCIDVVDSINGTRLGSSTWQAQYGSTASGTKLGTNTTENAYYKGYKYKEATTATVTENGATVYRIFNLVTQNIQGTVKWIDYNNKYNLRQNATVTLSRTPTTGVVKQISPNPITVVPDSSKTDGQKVYTFQGVQKYDTTTGKPYTYSVSQNSMPHYTTKIDGYNITNTLKTYSVSGKVFIDSVGGNEKFDDREGLANAEVALFDSTNKFIAITLSDSNGNYSFTELDPTLTYKIRFTYNGVLFTNVATGIQATNSKAQENNSQRDQFNQKFAEIGSYPANYQTTDWKTGEKISNPIYKQEDIKQLFNKVSQKIVELKNEKEAYEAIINENGGGDTIRKQVQFIRDCRVYAYVNNLGVINGNYSQTNINCGIKVRPTVDFALTTDVNKVKVTINDKTASYNYNKNFTYLTGIDEKSYQTDMRGIYISSIPWQQESNIINIHLDTMYIRPEDIKNGQLEGYYNELYKQCKTELEEDKKLQVYVTYKIGIKNQSQTTGAITEIVDYRDRSYDYIDAYVGDKDGNKIGEVAKKEDGTIIQTSKYGTNTEYKDSNSYYTIYLRPVVETKLNQNEEQYIYVTFKINNNTKLEGLLNNKEFITSNITEINGYKTYNSKENSKSPGLIDKDSIPGNTNQNNIKELINKQEIKEDDINIPRIKEDDINIARIKFKSTSIKDDDDETKRKNARKIEGVVFEDYTGKAHDKVDTNRKREGNGTLDEGETKVHGAEVILRKCASNEEIATTTTNEDGWYGFIGMVPGDYYVQFKYGNRDETILTTDTLGIDTNTIKNKRSYNGQNYQSTKYQEQTENYWYTNLNSKSDAKDTDESIDRVKNYSNSEYEVAMNNHKVQVFNSYKKIADWDKMQELKDKTYREANTKKMPVEIEYATEKVDGGNLLEHKIQGIDFGIVERPKAQLAIDQDIEEIKLTLSDNKTIYTQAKLGDDAKHVQWLEENKNGKNEQVNIVLDDELMHGAKLEITYNLTITNNGEQDIGKTQAKNVINYVANNLSFDENDEVNGDNWEVVTKGNIQKTKIENGDKVQEKDSLISKEVDLSTQNIIIKATNQNPLVTKPLAPKESTESVKLKLTRILSPDSSTDDLTYTNMTEIVEIYNEEGRYDEGATPGNQKLEEQPKEHDTSGASKNTGFGTDGNVDSNNPPDGIVKITPPTGQTHIYYITGIISIAILAVGVFLIKKYVYIH